MRSFAKNPTAAGEYYRFPSGFSSNSFIFILNPSDCNQRRFVNITLGGLTEALENAAN
jgi:hypothetical protein